MSDFAVLIANNLLEIVFAAIGVLFTTVVLPWVKNTAIPWLKEKHIYSLVQKFVKAAEKKAEAGTLAKPLKKDYVIGLLEAICSVCRVGGCRRDGGNFRGRSGINSKGYVPDFDVGNIPFYFFLQKIPKKLSKGIDEYTLSVYNI